MRVISRRGLALERACQHTTAPRRAPAGGSGAVSAAYTASVASSTTAAATIPSSWQL